VKGGVPPGIAHLEGGEPQPGAHRLEDGEGAGIAGQGGKRAIGCGWRELGRGGDAGGGSTLSVPGGRACAETEFGFEFEFAMPEGW